MEYFCNFALKMSTITPTYCPHISQTRTRCPHTYGVRVCPCAAFATEPCRPTACISRAHSPAVPCPLPPVRWTFTFSAKEKDSETGLSYFGSRYYNSDLSIWLSVDPMSDKYPLLSPYVYCADNPVRLVDPNGEDVWIPEVTENGDIRLLYEEGDDYKSLSNFLGDDLGIFSKRQIDKMWNNRDEKGNVTLSKNIFSKAIKKAMKLNYPPEEDILKYDDWAAAEKAGYRKNYNCFSAAMDAAMGDELGCGLVKDLDEDLEYGKWYSTNAPVFGKTLLRFEYKGKAKHSATYFGKDHSGNTYVFTKNGPFPAPKIMLLQDVENIPGYGTVTPLRTDTKRLQGNSGMYNYGH